MSEAYILKKGTCFLVFAFHCHCGKLYYSFICDIKVTQKLFNFFSAVILTRLFLFHLPVHSTEKTVLIHTKLRSWRKYILNQRNELKPYPAKETCNWNVIEQALKDSGSFQPIARWSHSHSSHLHFELCVGKENILTVDCVTSWELQIWAACVAGEGKFKAGPSIFICRVERDTHCEFSCYSIKTNVNSVFKVRGKRDLRTLLLLFFVCCRHKKMALWMNEFRRFSGSELNQCRGRGTHSCLPRERWNAGGLSCFSLLEPLEAV